MKNLAFKSLLALFVMLIILSIKNLKAEINDFNFNNEDSLTGISSLMGATIDNDVDGVKFFVKAGNDIVNQKNIGGATALHLAARNNNAEISELLIENGANVNATDNENWTPLMRASIAKNPKIVEMLIDKGADARKFNILHETAIIHSADSECLECLNIMFDKYDFSKMDRQTLKDQINEAAVISRNKDNGAMQTALSNYAVKSNQIIPSNNAVDGNVMIQKNLDFSDDKKAVNNRYHFIGEIRNKNKMKSDITKNKVNSMITKQPEVEIVEQGVTPITKTPEGKNIQKKYIFKKIDDVSKKNHLLKTEELNVDKKGPDTKSYEETILEIKEQDISDSKMPDTSATFKELNVDKKDINTKSYDETILEIKEEDISGAKITDASEVKKQDATKYKFNKLHDKTTSKPLTNTISSEVVNETPPSDIK